MSGERKSAFRILRAVEEEGAWSNLAINSELEKTDADPAFVRHLVNLCLRNSILLEATAKKYLKKKTDPNTSIILKLGMAQLLWMDSVSDYAAADESVKLARSFAKGREGLVNAVLRSFIRDGKKLADTDDPGIKYSAKQWIVDLWTEAYGAQKAAELLEASNQPSKLVIRANTLKITREELISQLNAGGFDARESLFSPFGIEVSGSGLLGSKLFKQGLFAVQEEASQLAVIALDPKPGDFVIDMCAAPGGKSMLASQLMQGRGRIIATDLYEARTNLIKKEADRLGITNVECFAADASKPVPQFAGRADKIICDVPCSGLGVIREKPEIKLREEPGKLGELYALQRSILRNASAYLKDGGSLLYSTCTLNPKENGEAVREFLSENEAFSLVSERQIFTGEDGLDGFYISIIRKDNDQRRI